MPQGHGSGCAENANMICHTPVKSGRRETRNPLCLDPEAGGSFAEFRVTEVSIFHGVSIEVGGLGQALPCVALGH